MAKPTVASLASQLSDVLEVVAAQQEQLAVLQAEVSKLRTETLPRMHHNTLKLARRLDSAPAKPKWVSGRRPTRIVEKAQA